MKEYTEKIHAERVLKILEKPNTCDRCPANLKFTIDNDVKLRAFMWKNSPCQLCNDFIGIGETAHVNTLPLFDIYPCPCKALGSHEALKRTWLKLEELGYVESCDRNHQCD